MTYEYNVQLTDMPCRVKSFVRQDADGYNATIVINAKLNRESQVERYKHEIRHMGEDDFEKSDADQVENCAHGRT